MQPLALPMKHSIRSSGLAGVSALILLSALPSTAQMSLKSSTIDAGGGRSVGGSFVLTGTVGQADASQALTGGRFSLTGGFWGAAEGSLTGGYADWAASNIPAGQDASFRGDWNKDGVPNGLEYAFGDAGFSLLDSGVLAAPSEPVPDDVVLRLVYSADLIKWETHAEWLNGAAPILDPTVTIENGILTDLFRSDGGAGFWRYDVELLP